MDIIISSSSGRPIYEQIIDQIKSAIVTGQLAEGLIETVQGKGTYVAGGNAELIREEQMREVEGLLAKAVERGRTIGLTDGELSEMFALVLE